MSSTNGAGAPKKTTKKKKNTGTPSLEHKKPAKKKPNKSKPDGAKGHPSAQPNEEAKVGHNQKLGIAAGRMIDAEMLSLLRHVVHVDEVYKLVLAEMSKKLSDGQDGFHEINASLIERQHVLVLVACRELRDMGAKPSDDDFRQRLRTETLAISQDLPFKYELHPDDIPGYLDSLEQGNIGLTARYGIELFQKYLRVFRFHKSIGRYLDAAQAGASPEDVHKTFKSMQEMLDQINSLTPSAVTTFDQRLPHLLKSLAETRGKSLLGLKTGIATLDEQVKGLRGLSLVCSPPGVGKTNFVTELAIGVLKHHKENNCAVLMLSLEMTELEISARMLSNLSNLPAQTIYLGDQPGQPEDGYLSLDSVDSIQQGQKQLKSIGKRLLLADRTVTGEYPSAVQINALARRIRDLAGASNVLVIVDYIQLLDKGGSTGLDADRFQIGVLQQVVQAGYTVLAISEVRKPENSKSPWGHSIADLKGDSRLGYAADTVYLLEPMSDPEVAQCYKLSSTTAGNKSKMQKFRQGLDEKGKAPLCLHVAKARDVARRGRLYFEFQFRKSKMKPLLPQKFADQPGLEDEDTLDEDEYEDLKA